MTWTKLSDDFPEDCESLSDSAFRVHVEALCWTMRRETGGVMSERDIRRGIEQADPAPCIAELIDKGYWSSPEDGQYLIVHHMDHQPDPKTIKQRRQKTAKRVRRYRKQQPQK